VLGEGQKSVYHGGKILNHGDLRISKRKLMSQNIDTDFPHNEFSITEEERVDNSNFYIAEVEIKESAIFEIFTDQDRVNNEIFYVAEIEANLPNIFKKSENWLGRKP
jgi:hypothetical protein